MVYTTVTIADETREMWLPILNGANKAMKKLPYKYKVKGWNGAADTEKDVESMTMFDVNTSIMRCLVKNLAMFGLGIYIYAGEDLPEKEPVKELTNAQRVKIKAQMEEEGYKDDWPTYEKRLKKVYTMSDDDVRILSAWHKTNKPKDK